MSKAGWGLEEVDLYELNEAFAAQAVAVQRELGVQEDKVVFSAEMPTFFVYSKTYLD